MFSIFILSIEKYDISGSSVSILQLELYHIVKRTIFGNLSTPSGLCVRQCAISSVQQDQMSDIDRRAGAASKINYPFLGPLHFLFPATSIHCFICEMRKEQNQVLGCFLCQLKMTTLEDGM